MYEDTVRTCIRILYMYKNPLNLLHTRTYSSVQLIRVDHFVVPGIWFWSANSIRCSHFIISYVFSLSLPLYPAFIPSYLILPILLPVTAIHILYSQTPDQCWFLSLISTLLQSVLLLHRSCALPAYLYRSDICRADSISQINNLLWTKNLNYVDRNECSF